MGKSFTRSVVLKIALVALYVLALGSVIGFIMLGNNNAILNPQGSIADQQKTLMIIATLLMLVVVIPVFILTFWISWKYRASNKNAKHAPNSDGNRLLEAIWWGLPCLIIGILGIIIWQSSHALDPYKPLAHDKQPITIQVVAMQWKWLFIYPDESIATVNYIKFPEKTPVNFQITSDAPMNSFWIPSLGGQVYAMSGMSTKLHLIADRTGSYNGSSANLSGEGFAGMKFVAQSVSDSDYKNWVAATKRAGKPLGAGGYNDLSEPSQNNPQASYKLTEPDLYAKIIDKYMGTMEHSTDHMKAGH